MHCSLVTSIWPHRFRDFIGTSQCATGAWVVVVAVVVAVVVTVVVVVVLAVVVVTPKKHHGTLRIDSSQQQLRPRQVSGCIPGYPQSTRSDAGPTSQLGAGSWLVNFPKKHQGTLRIDSSQQHLRSRQAFDVIPGYPQSTRSDGGPTSQFGRGSWVVVGGTVVVGRTVVSTPWKHHGTPLTVVSQQQPASRQVSSLTPEKPQSTRCLGFPTLQLGPGSCVVVGFSVVIAVVVWVGWKHHGTPRTLVSQQQPLL